MIAKSLEQFKTIPKTLEEFKTILTNKRRYRLLQDDPDHFEIRLTPNYEKVSEFRIDSMIHCCQIDRAKAGINSLHS